MRRIHFSRHPSRSSLARMGLLAVLSLGLGGCEEPRIYGSVGFSSYSGGGYYGGGGMGTSISIGGRIY